MYGNSDTLEAVAAPSRRVRPVREQVYAQIRAMASPEHAKVGQKMPSFRELARQLDVSISTVQEALRMMQEEGLVSCVVGRGTFVSRTLTPSEVISSQDRSTIPTVAVLVGPLAKISNSFRSIEEGWGTTIGLSMQQELTVEGYAIRLTPVDCREGQVKVAEQQLEHLAEAISGVVAFPTPGVEDLRPWAERAGLPWVSINQPNSLVTHNFVSADYYGGGFKVGRLFARWERTNVLYLRSRCPSTSDQQKLHGLRAGMEAEGGSSSRVEVIECDGVHVDDGIKGTREYLRTARVRPQAIFSHGDYLSLGAMKACQEQGLRVPEEVAVVGSTGLEVGEHSTPTLTMMRPPIVEMGVEAARMLIALIRGKTKTIPGKILPVDLVERGSTPSHLSPAGEPSAVPSEIPSGNSLAIA